MASNEGGAMRKNNRKRSFITRNPGAGKQFVIGLLNFKAARQGIRSGPLWYTRAHSQIGTGRSRYPPSILPPFVRKECPDNWT